MPAQQGGAPTLTPVHTARAMTVADMKKSQNRRLGAHDDIGHILCGKPVARIHEGGCQTPGVQGAFRQASILSLYVIGERPGVKLCGHEEQIVKMGPVDVGSVQRPRAVGAGMDQAPANQRLGSEMSNSGLASDRFQQARRHIARVRVRVRLIHDHHKRISGQYLVCELVDQGPRAYRLSRLAITPARRQHRARDPAADFSHR